HRPGRQASARAACRKPRAGADHRRCQQRGRSRTIAGRTPGRRGKRQDPHHRHRRRCTGRRAAGPVRLQPQPGSGRNHLEGHRRADRRTVFSRPQQRGTGSHQRHPRPARAGGTETDPGPPGRGPVRLAAVGRLADQPAAGGGAALAHPAAARLELEAAPMMDIWPHLLRPFWLLILPLPLWLLWHLWHRQRQQGSWQRLLPVAFHDTLLTGGRVRNSRLPWLALGGAWLLTWLALLGPSWQQLEQPSLKRAAPLVVLLEMTPAMLAGDLQPTRLEHARHKVLDLLRLRQDAQTAVVVFAGSAHTLVPLSDDLATTENLLDAIRPELMPEDGHRADLAVAQALALLEQGAQGRGQVLLIGSTLAAEEQAGIASLLAGSGWRLSILGIGTEQGAPIAQQGGGFLKDPQGAILIPQLDAKGLQRFANELGGRYQSASLDDADLLALGLHETGNAATQASEASQLSVWLDQGHWLLLPLLVLAACAARRGWLFCLPLLLLVPPSAQAFEFDDLWLRPDQQGQRLLEAQRPADAAQRFE